MIIMVCSSSGLMPEGGSKVERTEHYCEPAGHTYVPPLIGCINIHCVASRVECLVDAMWLCC